MNCIKLKKRTKQGRIYYFCSLKKCTTTFCECKDCKFKEYKPIKKIKKRTYKLAKAEKNRFSIITNQLDYCIECGKPKQALHEVYYGRNRQNSIKYGLVIPLCFECHKKIHIISKLNRKYRNIARIKFDEYYDLNFNDIFK